VVDSRCSLQKVGAPRVEYDAPPAGSKWACVYLCQCPPLAAFTKESGRQIVFKVDKTKDILSRLASLRSTATGLRKNGDLILKMFIPVVPGDETNAERELLNLVCAMGLAWPHRNEEGALKTETVCVAPWQIGLLQDLMLRIAEKYDYPKLHTEPRLPVPVPPRVEPRLSVPVATRAEPRLPLRLPRIPDLFAQPWPSSSSLWPISSPQFARPGKASRPLESPQFARPKARRLLHPEALSTVTARPAP